MRSSVNQTMLPRAGLPETLRRLSFVEGAGSLIVMPDVGGNTLYARPLVAELADECSCYAVQLGPATVASLAELSVEDLGRQFAEAIVAAQLHGPVHVLGYSFAGFLAHETARQLALLGATPEMVWILDLMCYHPLTLRGFMRYPIHHARNIALYLRWNWRRLLLGQEEPELLAAYGISRIDLRKHPESYRHIIRGNHAALQRYRAGSTNAPTTLLRAMQDSGDWSEDGMGWRDLVSAPFRVIDVPGDHLTMLRQPEHAHVIAQHIRANLP